jgi:hypothetical protein
VNGFRIPASEATMTAVTAVTATGVADAVDGPFKSFPSGLHDQLRPFFADITEEVVRAIRTEIPEYARPTDDTYMQVVHQGVEHALQGFLQRMAEPDGDGEPVRATYQRIGRGEADEGRSLDAFQSALRLGARVAWRRINALVDADLLPRHVLAAFGEALFLHLDQMAAATTTGYTEARLHAAGELRQRRTRLIDLLIVDPPASVAALTELAHTAQWPVPRSLAVVVIDRGSRAAGPPPIVPPEFLARFDVRPAVLVVPDPEGPGRARAVAGALQGLRAAMGPNVALQEGHWTSPGGVCCPTRGWCGAGTIWPRCCCSVTRPWWTRWPTGICGPWTGCGCRSGSGWRRHCSPGWSAATTRARSRRGSPSIRRRSAIACGSWTNCSATGSTTRRPSSRCNWRCAR